MEAYSLIQLQLPEARRKDKASYIMLDTYISTKYSKLAWYSEEENSIFLDIPYTVDDFCNSLQHLVIGSDETFCTFRHTLLEHHKLSEEGVAWLDDRLQIRLELAQQLLPETKVYPIPPFLHLVTIN
ncbi:hypothetical protein [Psychromonas sp.]|uniref:hypothetical protein n=1 Tax=Psychromonas sp. TaxID=1884585 RepID=UPI0039E3100A